VTSRLCGLVLAVTTGGACLPVTHNARRAPLADPSLPPLRVESLTTNAVAGTPGEEVIRKRARGPDIRGKLVVTSEGARLRRAGQGGRWAVVVGARLSAGTGDRRVEVIDLTWSPASAPRCAGGLPALDIMVDVEGLPYLRLDGMAQVRWERPVVLQGERVVFGRFEENRELLRQPTVMDVHLIERNGAFAREACVRVPVTGQDITYWADKGWSVGVHMGWRRALAFTPGSVFTLGPSFGRWLGPVRLAVGGLFGWTGAPVNHPRDQGLCFLGPGPDCDHVDVGGLALEASGVARRGSRWAVGWSLAYEVLYAEMERADPVTGVKQSRRATSGGPRLGVRVLRVPPKILGLSHVSPTHGWGFELFAAAARTWSGQAAGAPLTFGVALVAF
jgi:hypothetical protein